MNILLARTVVIHFLVIIPTESLPSVLNVANMCWQVCGKLFHKLWNPLKDLQSASFGIGHSGCSKLIEREQCLVMKYSSTRWYRSRRRVQVHHERNELIN